MNNTVIDRDPDILRGTPVFRGTRVPVRILFEHLEAGDGLEVFFTDFPSVTPRHVCELPRMAREQPRPETKR